MDLLSSVRVSCSSSSSSSSTAVPVVSSCLSATAEPLAKKQKTAINKDKGGNNNNNGNLPVVTFVTGNANKLEEVKRILQTANGDNNANRGTAATRTARLPLHLVNKSLDLPELQGDDVLAIAREKCLVASQKVGGGAVIIEDTSLCFNALHGLPGPYIKWFLDSCGHDGLNRMLAGFDDKTAYAQTVVAYCPGTNAADATTPAVNAVDVVIFSGRTNGTIVPARGKLDFGWDPIFEPFESVSSSDDGSKDEKKKTYAEMTKDEKDSISHRSRAFLHLREYLIRMYSDDDDDDKK
jgi:inosine triphosphate pyrophosphatase